MCLLILSIAIMSLLAGFATRMCPDFMLMCRSVCVGAMAAKRARPANGLRLPVEKVRCWIYIAQHMNSRQLHTVVCLRKLASDLGKWIEMVFADECWERIMFTEQCRLTDGDIKWRKHKWCSSIRHSSYPIQPLKALWYITNITFTWVIFRHINLCFNSSLDLTCLICIFIFAFSPHCLSVQSK